MFSFWPALLFGWPALIVALLLSAAGIIRNKPIWLGVAAVVVIPFSFYLAGSPRFGWMGLAMPLFLVGAAISVRFCKVWLAWSLLAPFTAISSWLAFVVISQ